MLSHIHGEDGGHSIDRSDEDSYLTDPYCQQQRPGGLTIRLPVTEDLRQSQTEREGLTQHCVYHQGQKGQQLPHLISDWTVNSLQVDTIVQWLFGLKLTLM